MSLSEYRVTWQREGHRAKSKLYQSQAPAERHALIVAGRIAEATGLDPEALACCDGRECGCSAATNAEVWAAQNADMPRLVVGPVIQSRPVGEWS